jgi:hypothetical protein
MPFLSQFEEHISPMIMCAHTSTDHVTRDIYGDSGEKGNIFECDSIGQCVKKYKYQHVSNSESLPR